jgi:hypothetical protein
MLPAGDVTQRAIPPRSRDGNHRDRGRDGGTERDAGATYLQEQTIARIDHVDAGAFIDTECTKTTGVRSAAVHSDDHGAMSARAVRERTGGWTLVGSRRTASDDLIGRWD